MRTTTSLLLLLAVLPACGGRFSPRTPTVEPPPGGGGGGSSDDTGDVQLPAFLGVDSALAEDGAVIVRWAPVVNAQGAPADDVSYLVYTASTADAFDFSVPALETAPA